MIEMISAAELATKSCELAKIAKETNIGQSLKELDKPIKESLRKNEIKIDKDCCNSINDFDERYENYLQNNEQAQKYSDDNPQCKDGFRRLEGCDLQNDPSQVRLFSSSNMDGVAVNKENSGLHSFHINSVDLGTYNSKEKTFYLKTYDNINNPLIDQKYTKINGVWPNPDKNQTLPPNSTFVINDGQCIVKTDHLGRKISQVDKLELTSQPKRDLAAQVNSKELYNGLNDDQGGHTCAASLGGIRESINYTPMNKYVNEQGEIRQLERKCSNYLKEGKIVTQETKFNYNDNDGIGGRYRPESYEKTLIVDVVKHEPVTILNRQ